MADAIFAQLQQGLRFDKKKWGKHIALFEQPAGQQGGCGGGACYQGRPAPACLPESDAHARDTACMQPRGPRSRRPPLRRRWRQRRRRLLPRAPSSSRRRRRREGLPMPQGRRKRQPLMASPCLEGSRTATAAVRRRCPRPLSTMSRWWRRATRTRKPTSFARHTESRQARDGGLHHQDDDLIIRSKSLLHRLQWSF